MWDRFWGHMIPSSSRKLSWPMDLTLPLLFPFLSPLEVLITCCRTSSNCAKSHWVVGITSCGTVNIKNFVHKQQLEMQWPDFPAETLIYLSGREPIQGMQPKLHVTVQYMHRYLWQLSVHTWKALTNTTAGEQLSKVLQRPFSDFVDCLLQLTGRM